MPNHPGVGIARLSDAGNHANEREDKWIGRTLEHEVKLLLRSERGYVRRAIHQREHGHHAEGTLLLCFPQDLIGVRLPFLLLLYPLGEPGA